MESKLDKLVLDNTIIVDYIQRHIMAQELNIFPFPVNDDVTFTLLLDFLSSADAHKLVLFFFMGLNFNNNPF